MEYLANFGISSKHNTSIENKDNKTKSKKNENKAKNNQLKPDDKEKEETVSENSDDEEESDLEDEIVDTTPNQALKTNNSDFIQSLTGENLKLFNEIYTSCFTNNAAKLSQTISDFVNSTVENSEISARKNLIASLLNKRLTKENGFSLLHFTSQMGHFECIWHLLLNGADPSNADLTKQNRLPYFLSVNKQTRDQYRRFFNDFPTRYDYVKAKISDPLSMEKLNERQEKDKEKKRKKNKQKKQKESQQKQKKMEEERELNERKKFLELTDQEKKKLILDRNFLNLLPLDKANFSQQTTNETVPTSNTNTSLENSLSSPKYSTDEFKVISRCWYCAVDNSSNVPFEYFDYKFCSTKCLKAHREQQQNQQSKNVVKNKK